MNVKQQAAKQRRKRLSIWLLWNGGRQIQCYNAPDCNNDLILDSSFRLKNPLAGGKGYWCGSCAKVFNISLVHLHKKPKAVTSTIGGTRNQDFIFQYVPEDKGINDQGYDEYTKYDPEPNADQFPINLGATIIDSRIEITDSEGSHRTLVKSKIM